MSDAVPEGEPEPTVPSIAPVSSTSTSVPTTSAALAAMTAEIEPLVFTGLIDLVDEEFLGESWHPDCPVDIGDLRLLTVAHHVFDGNIASGQMVVHADHADDLLTVFEAMFDAGFAVERMELITAYGGDDVASMRANNSSGFNCRVIDGTSRWSQHAYGTAIDINPLINPWVRGSTVDPPEGAAYLDREADVPGLIRADDEVVRAFEAIGWSWGGYWTGSVDYQHFSANGR